MCFPFLTCEVKGSGGLLDVADRQNAHSMTIAVRGIVELFKLVDREGELHRKVLTFSISHDDKSVRIYGHYAMTKERVPTFHRHQIRSFDLAAQDGAERWTACRFTKNVYLEFMPKLHRLLCSAIDQPSPRQASRGSDHPPPIPRRDDCPSADRGSEVLDLSTTSQITAGPKKERATASAVLQQQLDSQKLEYGRQVAQWNLQLNQIAKQLERHEQQRQEERQEEMKQQRELRNELERQKQESKDELERQEQESKDELERRKQESKEQFDQLMSMMR